MTYPITVRVALEVAHHEAVVRQAYKDSVGVWTWSVGLTSMSGHMVERYIGKPQPLEHCIAVYLWALNNYADDVRSKFKSVQLTEAQFAAALSFHWNTGAIRNATWANEFIAGNHIAARNSIMNWKSPPEIIPRRGKERDLFFDGDWSNDGKITEWTTVRTNGTIDWSKSRRHDIVEMVNRLLGISDTIEPPLEPAPEITVPEIVDGEVVTPAWTAEEHLANIRASTFALEELLAGKAD